MDGVRQGDAKIAMDIVERGPSVALRMACNGGATLFITQNVSKLGYEREDFLNGSLCWPGLVHPADAAALARNREGFAEQKMDSYTLTYRVMKKDGASLWVSDASTLVRDKKGEAQYIDCVITDHSLAMENQSKVQDGIKQQLVFNDILQSMQSGKSDEIFHTILARTGEYLGLSRVMLFEDDRLGKKGLAMYEWDNGDVPHLMSAGGYMLDYQSDIPYVDAELKRSELCVIDAGAVPSGLARVFAREGLVASASYVVQNPAGGRYGFISFGECELPRRWETETLIFLKNIAKLASAALMRKNSEESISRMAYKDQLTGLLNRYRFDVYMDKAIEDAHTSGGHGFVVFLDMDDFKIINDAYGHDYGDALILSVANYLRRFEAFAKVFRFGGDEFTILVEERHAERAQNMLDEMIARARHPWQVMDREFYCTLSIGVVRFPDGDFGVTDIVKNADIAMYQAKSRGKNNYVIFNDDLRSNARHRAETEHRMRDAIDNAFTGFDVYYQPTVDMSGEVIGAEALVRWVDSEGNLVPPTEFIPLAEYLGLIVPLGEFVMREAATMCAAINRDFPRFTMSINVSIRQFQQHDFLERVENVLRQSGVNFSNVVLEVTEGMVVQDMEHMQTMVEQLRGMGLKIAMDDFGTGYSSLNNMRELPLDIIKIDRIFIRDLATDAYSKSFVRLITDLGHSMGRSICVEGVETPAQYAYCADCGADILQGFYFYQPMPSDEFEKLIVQGIGKPAKAGK